MMTLRRRDQTLVSRLPNVRGGYTEGALLGDMTWFRVGGPAEVLFRPADRDDLMTFLARRPKGVAITVIGVGANLLVRDGGVPGVVIRLGRGFATVEVDGSMIRAGAAAPQVNIALAARDAGLTGLEFMRGIPGTLGGALRMNAGAFGGEIASLVIAADVIDPEGRAHTLSAEELGYAYRHCGLPEDWIFAGASLAGQPGDPEAITRRMEEIVREREENQPAKVRTGGSTFKNPPGARAWELIEAAGCRGLRRGGAMVSDLHCNFLINGGAATAADLEALGEDVRRRVFEASGIRLEWEIRRIGVAATTGPRELKT